MNHHTYVVRYDDPDGGPPSYRAHCRDCDRHTSKYWLKAEALCCPDGHVVDEDHGDVPAQDNEEAEILRAMWAPGTGIGGMYGTDCERAFRAGWLAARAAYRQEDSGS